jgi:hypothetical protein
VTFDPEQLRRIQTLVEKMAPALKEYERIQQRLNVFGAMHTPVLDAIREHERNHAQFVSKIEADAISSQKLIAAVQALEAAGRLFLTLPPIATIQMGEIDTLAARLNDGMFRARLIADIDVSATSDVDELLNADDLDSRLVQVVPAEVLTELRRVEFAPLLLLDRALRDPEMMRRELSPRQFEGLIASLIEELGFQDVVLTPRSGDGGRDVIATMTFRGLKILCAFECKQYAANNHVGPDVARALLGTVRLSETRATQGILVTTSYFTPAARRLIITEPSLEGRDFDGIVEWLREYGAKRRSG